MIHYLSTHKLEVEYHSKKWNSLVLCGWITNSVNRQGVATMTLESTSQ